jgi:NIMA (never in mitosis gene a)-related kinase
MSTAEKKQLVAEVNILRELRHPNIVRYYERFVDKENCLIYIIMEYCAGGDLAAVIKRCKKDGCDPACASVCPDSPSKIIAEDIVWNILAQLLSALHECHSGQQSDKKGAILHRDIKPEVRLHDLDMSAD